MQKESDLETVIKRGNECLERVHGFDELEGEEIFEIEDFEKAIRDAKKRRASIKMQAAVRFHRASELRKQGVAKDEMRDKLIRFIENSDFIGLEETLEDAKAVLGLSDKYVLQSAKILGEGKLKEKLNKLEECGKESLKYKNVEILKIELREVEEFVVKELLSEDDRFIQVREDTKNLISYIEEVKQCEKLIQKLNRAKIAEIVSYGQPPNLVYTVVRSLLYLLGEKKETCGEWKIMRSIFKETGKRNIQNRIATFDPTTVTLVLK